MITSGRNFTDAEEMPGSYSAIVAKDEMIGKNRKVLKNVILDDNTVLIYGNKYDIVGVVSGFPVLMYRSYPCRAKHLYGH